MEKNNDSFLAFTSAVNQYDLNQMQYDALWDLLNDNPLLPSSSIASRNKALKTSKQNVIGAINELLSKLENQGTTITTFETKINTVMGDIAGTDNEAWETLKTIDTNVVRAIVKIWVELGGPDNGLDISDIGKSVKEALRNLNNKINGHEERITALEEKVSSNPATQSKVCEEPTLDPENNNKVILTQVPNDHRIILVVNGVEYDEGDDFEVNRPEKYLTWLGKGFDLEEGDELDVEYFINK